MHRWIFQFAIFFNWILRLTWLRCKMQGWKEENIYELGNMHDIFLQSTHLNFPHYLFYSHRHRVDVKIILGNLSNLLNRCMIALSVNREEWNSIRNESFEWQIVGQLAFIKGNERLGECKIVSFSLKLTKWYPSNIFESQKSYEKLSSPQKRSKIHIPWQNLVKKIEMNVCEWVKIKLFEPILIAWTFDIQIKINFIKIYFHNKMWTLLFLGFINFNKVILMFTVSV